MMMLHTLRKNQISGQWEVGYFAPDYNINSDKFEPVWTIVATFGPELKNKAYSLVNHLNGGGAY